MMASAAELIVRATLLLGLAWASDRWLSYNFASAASRYAVWVSAFGALTILPLCSVFGPEIPLPILPAQQALPSPSSVFVQPPIHQVTGDPAIDLRGLATGIYFVGAIILLARVAAGWMMLERWWRSSTPLSDARALNVAERVRTLLGIARSPKIRLRAEVTPMTWGARRPRVLLPSEAVGWPEERLTSVLLHEFGHIARYDTLARLGVETICALYWIHPAVWLAARSTRLAQEQASDDLALTHGAAAMDYARLLLATANVQRGPLSAVAMAAPTDLERRLGAILEDRARAAPHRAFVLLTTASGCALAVLMAAIVPVPAIAQDRAASVRETLLPASQALAQPVETRAPVYTQASRSRVSPAIVTPAPAARAGRVKPIGRSLAVPDPGPADAQLASYAQEVKRYDLALKRYSEDLKTYDRANADYIRQSYAYHVKMARIGPDPPPGITVPVQPTAPTAPTAPAIPTVPTIVAKPAALPVLHRP